MATSTGPRRVAIAADAAAIPKDSIDYWLGGFVIFGVVIGALVGGGTCAFVLAESPDFKTAIHHAPLVLGWTVLIAAEGAISWAGVFPSITAWWVSTKASEPRNRKWMPLTLAAIIAAIVLGIVEEPTVFPLDVPWPLGASHHARVSIMSLLVLIPPFIALGGMWSSAVAAFELSFVRPGVNDVDVVATYLELRDRVQSLLWYVGVVIGGAVLATGTLRKCLLDAGMSEDRYPATLVLGYGAFFTLLLIISYVPAYLLLQRGGKRLVYSFASGDTVLTWNDDREKLSTMLVPTVGLGETLKNSIAILAPIVAGFLSLALPK